KARRRERCRQGLSLRRPYFRGFQAVDRHMGQHGRRPRFDHQRLRALCARCGADRARPQPYRRVASPRHGFCPQDYPGADQSRRGRDRGRQDGTQGLPGAARQAGGGRDGKLKSRRARHHPRFATFGRQERDHGQGLRQPGGGLGRAGTSGRRPLLRSGPSPRAGRLQERAPMSAKDGLRYTFEDAWLVDGVRTPFVDYTGAFAEISPIDLGIKVARAVIEKAGVKPEEIGTTIAGSMAQASFDAYMTPRHIGLYAGVPVERPAPLVQRICGTGIEVLIQAAELVERQHADLVLGVGTESMSRNPVAAYTVRGGFRMGEIAFKDFLWEALLDPACSCTMGDTAENLAREYQITREEVDRFAARSF